MDRRFGWVAAGAGFVLAVATSTLPWRDHDLTLGVWPRLALAAVGAGLIVLAARRPGGAVSRWAAVLGLSVLLYPSSLSLDAAGMGGPVVAAAATVGHVPPLVLTQVLPVLASERATGRSRRGWLTVVLAVAVAGFLVTGLAVAEAPGIAVWAPLSSVLWFGSFVLSPTACWTAIRGTVGERRQRAVVAALASILPVLIIAWCLSLGAIASEFGWTADFDVLIYGFCLATGVGGGLALAAVGPAGSWMLRTRTIVATFDVLIAGLVAILAGVGVIALGGLDVATGWAVVVGAGAALVVVLPWMRMRAWTERVVDPRSELRHELARTGGQGRERLAALQALRRVVGDPELHLALRADEHCWTAADGTATTGEGVVLARDGEGEPTGVAVSTSARVAALGDCTDLLHPALLEAAAAQAAVRADRAAVHERRRLSQDLHDGLQGRLLGLALNLQLTGRDLDDPTSRLALDETVQSLRALVDDVRALGGGRLPEVLVDDGLSAALESLTRPLGSTVSLVAPPERMTASTEAVAYFVVAEAVANALKHAGATAIDVSVTAPHDGRVQVRVSDDGVGGADPRAGSGLRSLAERVSSHGGALVVRDGDAAGTVVEAVLPCES